VSNSPLQVVKGLWHAAIRQAPDRTPLSAKGRVVRFSGLGFALAILPLLVCLLSSGLSPIAFRPLIRWAFCGMSRVPLACQAGPLRLPIPLVLLLPLLIDPDSLDD
jgi:hypothetical protein